MELRDLLSILTVYSHNFKVLHWNASGHKFDRTHALANEYYDMLAEDQDAIAEMAMRVGQNCVSYIEASEMISHMNGEYVMVGSDTHYCFDKFIRTTEIMLTDIMKAIMAILDSDMAAERVNVGIKSTLEAMFEKYDLQVRYLNKRRMDDAED